MWFSHLALQLLKLPLVLFLRPPHLLILVGHVFGSEADLGQLDQDQVQGWQFDCDMPTVYVPFPIDLAQGVLVFQLYESSDCALDHLSLTMLFSPVPGHYDAKNLRSSNDVPNCKIVANSCVTARFLYMRGLCSWRLGILYLFLASWSMSFLQSCLERLLSMV